jgi:hypothetical protein
MASIPRTYTIPRDLDAILHSKIGRGEISKFVTRALWDALKKEEDEFVAQLIATKTDHAYLELKEDFAFLEGEDFVGLEDFPFTEDSLDAK